MQDPRQEAGHPYHEGTWSLASSEVASISRHALPQRPQPLAGGKRIEVNDRLAPNSQPPAVRRQSHGPGIFRWYSNVTHPFGRIHREDSHTPPVALRQIPAISGEGQGFENRTLRLDHSPRFPSAVRLDKMHLSADPIAGAITPVEQEFLAVRKKGDECRYTCELVAIFTGPDALAGDDVKATSVPGVVGGDEPLAVGRKRQAGRANDPVEAPYLLARLHVPDHDVVGGIRRCDHALIARNRQADDISFHSQPARAQPLHGPGRQRFALVVMAQRDVSPSPTRRQLPPGVTRSRQLRHHELLRTWA